MTTTAQDFLTLKLERTSDQMDANHDGHQMGTQRQHRRPKKRQARGQHGRRRITSAVPLITPASRTDRGREAATRMSIMERLHVIDTCTRMAWHADQREWDELAEVFADQVILDYTSLNGGEPVTLTPARIVDGWRTGLGVYTATQHLLTNHLVDLDGAGAVCTAAFQATHRKTDDSLWTLGGSYRFDLLRKDDGRRITGVVMTVVWSDGER